MKFSISTRVIKEGLGKAQSIASKRTPLDITMSVLLSAHLGRLCLSATDLKASFIGNYDAVTEQTGQVCLNSRKLYEIIKSFPAQQVYIETENNLTAKIHDKDFNVEYIMHGANADNFPDIPNIADIDMVEIDAMPFRDLIEKGICIGAEPGEQKPHLVSAAVECRFAENRQSIRLVSTDGKRLCKAELFLGSEFYLPCSNRILVHKSGLAEMAKMIGSDGKVRFGSNEAYFVVQKNGETIMNVLTHGDFPAFEAILLYEGMDFFTVQREALKEMLKRMSIMTNESYKGAKFIIGDNRLEVASHNPGLGQSREFIPIEYTGQNLTLSLNPLFVVDALNHISSEKVLIYIKALDKPCYIRGLGKDDFLYLVMPILEGE